MNPTPRPAKTTPKKLPRKLLILVILTVVVGTVIFALLSYRAQETKRSQSEALAADKAAFAQVETDMARAYAAIVAAAGKPDNESNSKSCHTISHKMDDSDIHCVVSYTLKYMNNVSGNNLAQKIDESITKDGSFSPTSSKPLAESLILSTNEKQDYMKSYDMKSNGVRCDVQYAVKTNEAQRSVNGSNIEAVFRCDKQVVTAIYPLAR